MIQLSINSIPKFLTFEKADEGLKHIIKDYFKDFETLLAHCKLTELGEYKFIKEDIDYHTSLLNAILHSCTQNKYQDKFDTFCLNCPNFYVYFDKLFIGYNDFDIKRAIAELIYEYTEEVLSHKHHIMDLIYD